MSKHIDLKTILILILALLLLLKYCNNDSEELDKLKIGKRTYGVLKYKSDTLIQPKNIVIEKKGDDLFRDKIVVDTQVFYKDVDTAAILMDFFTKYVYRDSVKLPDSLGFVFVLDTISQNRILNRKYDFTINEKTYTNTIIVKDLPKNEYYIGFNANFDKYSLVNSVGGGFLFKSKKNENIYQLNTGLSASSTRTNPYIGGGVYFKINKRK